MQVVIDSNIFFSALIKDSITRKIIVEYPQKFLFPIFVLEELEDHLGELKQKSKLSDLEFNQVYKTLLHQMQMVYSGELTPFLDEALAIAKPIDIDDVVFFATTLAYPDSAIWSNDAKLKQQNRIRIVSTQEMMELIESKGNLS